MPKPPASRLLRCSCCRFFGCRASPQVCFTFALGRWHCTQSLLPPVAAATPATRACNTRRFGSGSSSATATAATAALPPPPCPAPAVTAATAPPAGGGAPAAAAPPQTAVQMAAGLAATSRAFTTNHLCSVAWRSAAPAKTLQQGERCHRRDCSAPYSAWHSGRGWDAMEVGTAANSLPKRREHWTAECRGETQQPGERP